MVYELNGRKNICIIGKAIAFIIILRTKFREIMTCLKLQVPKRKSGKFLLKGIAN